MMEPSEVNRFGSLYLQPWCRQHPGLLLYSLRSETVHVPRISRLLEVPSSSGLSLKHCVRFTQSAEDPTLLHMT